MTLIARLWYLTYVDSLMYLQTDFNSNNIWSLIARIFREIHWTFNHKGMISFLCVFSNVSSYWFILKKLEYIDCNMDMVLSCLCSHMTFQMTNLTATWIWFLVACFLIWHFKWPICKKNYWTLIAMLCFLTIAFLNVL